MTHNPFLHEKFPPKLKVSQLRREWSSYKKEMQNININSNAGEALQAESTEANILLISILSQSSEYCNAHG
jgi:hypothetical protein